MDALAEQMMRVASRAEDGPDGEPPMWADSAADYKDFCSNYRSQAKVGLASRGANAACFGLQPALHLLHSIACI